MLILEGEFVIFMVLLVSVQASARNVLVSPWYCVFPLSAVFGRVPGQDLDEDDKFRIISDVLYMGCTLSLMHHFLYWYRVSLLKTCLPVGLSSLEAYRCAKSRY